MNTFKDLELAYKKSLALVGHKIIRIAIHPMMAIYEYRKYECHFLHLEHKDEEGIITREMFEFDNTQDLLNKIISLENEL